MEDSIVLFDYEVFDISLSTIKKKIQEHDKYKIPIYVVKLNPVLFDMITREKVNLKLNNLHLILNHQDVFINSNVLGEIVLHHIPYLNKNNFIHTLNCQLTEYSKHKIKTIFNKNNYGYDFLNNKIQDIFYTKDYFILHINNNNYAFVNDTIIKLYNNNKNIYYNNNQFLTYNNKKVTIWKTTSTKNAYMRFNINKVIPKNELFVISDLDNKNHCILDNSGFHNYYNMNYIDLENWVMLYNNNKILLINSKNGKTYILKDCGITRQFIQLITKYKTIELFVKNVIVLPSIKTNY